MGSLMEYSIPESGPAYIPTPKKQLKLQNLALQQEEIVILNIGGELFTTSKPTLRADPSSILASLVSDASIPTLTGLFHYFLDRSPKAYHLIISYLRNNCRLDLISLPQDVPSLQELLCECAFLELDDLTKQIEQRIKGKLPFQ
jgi:hypothetical protein